MHVKYCNPGLEYSVNSILSFQTDDNTPFWSNSLFYFYPQINREQLQKINIEGRRSYLNEVMSRIYEEIKPEIDDKIIKYNNYFEQYANQINEALSEAFETDVYGLFEDLTAKICMNPVSPRFLSERSFEVFYKNSERGALGASLHEMIHFIWFYVWNQVFGDSYDEYEKPSLKWILSEMVVESIMSDKRLCSINPYFPHEQGGCVYPYFQDMYIDDKLILNTLDELYQNNNIKDYMKKSYEYCLLHEDKIRKHIAAAEK